MLYPGEGKKGQPKAGDYVLAAERVRAEAAASPHQTTEFDLARANRWEGKARTKQLPSTRTEIGAGGELIDIENRDAVRFSLALIFVPLLYVPGLHQFSQAANMGARVTIVAVYPDGGKP
jgi:hypothetical protein